MCASEARGEGSSDVMEQEEVQVPRPLPSKGLGRKEYELMVTYLHDVRTTLKNAKYLIVSSPACNNTLDLGVSAYIYTCIYNTIIYLCLNL